MPASCEVCSELDTVWMLLDYSGLTPGYQSNYTATVANNF